MNNQIELFALIIIILDNYILIMDSIQSLKVISGIETNSTFGWYVPLYRNKKTYSKFFSDSKFGGKDKALELDFSKGRVKHADYWYSKEAY